MRKLLMPIVTKFDEVLQCLLAESDPARQMSYAVCLSQAMGFARLGLSPKSDLGRIGESMGFARLGLSPESDQECIGESMCSSKEFFTLH